MERNGIQVGPIQFRAGSIVSVRTEQLRDVRGMQAVDVLRRMYRPEYLALVDIRRQWQLHENAVYVSVLVPTAYPIEQHPLGDEVDVGIRLEERRNTRVRACPLLHADVRRGIGAIANEHDGESGPAAANAAAVDRPTGEFERELGSDGVRDGLAVDDAPELRLPRLAFGPRGTSFPPVVSNASRRRCHGKGGASATIERVDRYGGV